MTELVLLAVTKMRSGVCIGGVALGLAATPTLRVGTRSRLAAGPAGLGGEPRAASREPSEGPPRWIRPVKPFGTLLPGDIRYRDGALMQPWDVAALELGRARPQPPHLEDVEVDLVHHRPERRGRLGEAERRELLERMVDPDPMELLMARQRSLTVFRPDALTATFSYDAYSGKYEARLWWPGCGRAEGLPVTELKWRALGRRLTAEGPAEQRLEETALRRLLGYDTVYVVAGLSRVFLGEYWPLVAAVHTLPEYEAEIDEKNL